MATNAQRANPGGMLAPDQVVGRDALVASLWDRLERQSLYITGERRTGKTSVVRDKMRAEPPDGWTVIYCDVSRAVTPLQFIEALLKASETSLGAVQKARFTVASFLNKLGGADMKAAAVGGKLPENLGGDWKRLLETLLRDLAELDAPRAVLALDELPLMLDAVRRRTATAAEGEARVMELLDTLRAARQESALRMIFTGSLGLHHVLTVLREAGYQNDPTNDMARTDLEPLTAEDAADLALRLFHGEYIAGSGDAAELEAVALHLAHQTDGVPYYIQHIIADIAASGDAVATVPGVDRRIRERLTDPLDPWQLDYFDQRIDTHYPESYRPLARGILDQLATGLPKTLSELAQGLDPEKVPTRDEETLRRVLRLLGLDHYTTVEEDGVTYRFRSPFLKRVWRSRRGMGA